MRTTWGGLRASSTTAVRYTEDKRSAGAEVFDIPVARPWLPSTTDLIPYLQRIEEKRCYSNHGPLATELEDRLSLHLGLARRGVVATASGTAGLFTTLLARGVARGSFCVLPSWTFAASPHAACAASLTPFFHDVDNRTWALDPHAVLETIKRISFPVGAIMVVSPFGAPIDMQLWEVFEERTGIPIVVDAAAAFDTVRPSRIPQVVSLHATKIMGCGEGGFVTTTDTELAERIRHTCSFGFGDDTRRAMLPSFNAKMSEYHAAVALAGLTRWPLTRRRHLQIANWYRCGLARLEGVELQPGYGREWVNNTTNILLAHGSAMQIASRLRQRGINTRAWWGAGCHVQPAFADYPRGPLPVTTDLAARVLGLPHFPDMRHADVDAVIGALSGIVEQLVPAEWIKARVIAGHATV